MEEDRELIAGHARHGIMLAGDRRKPAADDVEEAIARFVAEAIIDRLEAVEIDQHQIEIVDWRPSRGADIAIDAVEQQRPVGQAGDAVMDRIVEKLVLSAACRGDVA